MNSSSKDGQRQFLELKTILTFSPFWVITWNLQVIKKYCFCLPQSFLTLMDGLPLLPEETEELDLKLSKGSARLMWPWLLVCIVKTVTQNLWGPCFILLLIQNALISDCNTTVKYQIASPYLLGFMFVVEQFLYIV